MKTKRRGWCLVLANTRLWENKPKILETKPRVVCLEKKNVKERMIEKCLGLELMTKSRI